MKKPVNRTHTEKAAKKRRFSRNWLFEFNLSPEQVFRAIPFVLFLAFWAVIYIANRHYAEKTEREISNLTREVKDLRADYLTTKADLMFKTKQSEVAKHVRPLNLIELTEPPGKLKIRE